MNKADLKWIEGARAIAAQCWCDPETEKITMDTALAEAFAKRIAFWMEIAAQNQRNTDYYRGLIIRCGETIGRDAYVQDDGGISEDVLCAKVPELVKGLVEYKQRKGGSMGRIGIDITVTVTVDYDYVHGYGTQYGDPNGIVLRAIKVPTGADIYLTHLEKIMEAIREDLKERG